MRIFEKRVAKIKELASLGLTRPEIADSMAISIQSVGKYARQYSIDIKHAGLGRGGNPERSEAMFSMYKSGKTLAQIGDVYGITRERVRQILSKRGDISAQEGGQSKRASIKKSRVTSEKEARCLSKNGCTLSQLASIKKLSKEMISNGYGKYRTPTYAFQTQRTNALSRNIQWDLKLWDWWQVWQASGKWDQRGKGKDRYVMCRFKDDGPYSVDNVYIATHSNNSSIQPNNPYRKSHPDFDEAMANKKKVNFNPNIDRHNVHKGLPLGVTLKNGRYTAQICVDGRNKYIGSFATPEEAHSAYLSYREKIAA